MVTLFISTASTPCSKACIFEGSPFITNTSNEMSDSFIKAVDMWYKNPGVGSITGWNSKRGEVYTNGSYYYVKFYYGGGCTEKVGKNPYFESSRSSSYRKSCQYMVSISTDLGTVELFFDI